MLGAEWTAGMVGVVVLLVLACVALQTQAQSNRPLEYNLLEEQRPSTFVGNVKRDSNFSLVYSEEDLDRMQFNFRSSAGMYGAFRISQATGVIRTTRKINREDQCPYSDRCVIELDITVMPVKYFRIIKVLVHLLDINDHSPVFPRDRVSLEVAETTSTGTVLSTFSVEDFDSGSFGVQRFEFAYPVPEFDLKVSPHADGSRDVSLVLAENLDRETEEHYMIKIIAWDSGMPPKSGTITIGISVTDSNDNNPQFDNTTYIVQIYENLPHSTQVVQVHAQDADTGPNGLVFYEFPPHTLRAYGSRFGINNKTGLIFVKGDIDYEEEQMYSLNVMASDMGPNSLPSFAKVIVHVRDVNDHAPEITVNTFNAEGVAQVPENADIGHFVAHVAVFDKDSGHNGEVDCNIDSILFNLTQIEGVGYKITTKKVFDRETQDKYHLVMRCVDHGVPRQSATEQITITITDENDNAPQFTEPRYFVILPENNLINARILKMNATDRDIGQNARITYDIRGVGDTDSDAVIIDPKSGDIRANIEYDYERTQTYLFVVGASDAGRSPRSATTMLNLTILDVNDEPPVFSQRAYLFTVRENQDPNLQEIGYVAAEDYDSHPHNRILFTLDRYRSAIDKFDIDEKTGKIFAMEKLDHEEASEYHLTVIASNDDMSNIRSTAEVTIRVIDENDNPPSIDFPNGVNDTVQAPTVLAVGDLVTRVRAHDPDSGNNSVLSYGILNGNEDGTFRIDTQTGALLTVKDSVFDNMKLKKLVVQVHDSGTPQHTVRANLNIVFNRSLSYLRTESAGFLLLQGNNLMIVIGIIAGVLFIVIIITIAVCCVKAHRRRLKRRHIYKTQVHKPPNSPVSCGSIDKDSQLSCGEISSDKSIDNDSIGLKTKELLKKDTSFSVDMDGAYIDNIPPHWPLQDSKVIENRHVPHTEMAAAIADNSEPQPKGRSTSAPPPGLNRPNPVYPSHYQDRVERLRRGPPGYRHYPHPAMYNSNHLVGRAGPRHSHLTQEDLEMHDMLALSPTDMDSESGCSGADSGRGPSEEGDNYFYATQCQMEPFLSADSRSAFRQYDPRLSPFRPIAKGSFVSLPSDGVNGDSPVPQLGASRATSTPRPQIYRSPPERRPHWPSTSSPRSSTSSLRTSTPLTAALQMTCRDRLPAGCAVHRPPVARGKHGRLDSNGLPRFHSDFIYPQGAPLTHTMADPSPSPPSVNSRPAENSRYVPGCHADRLRVSDCPRSAAARYPLPASQCHPRGAPGSSIASRYVPTIQRNSSASSTERAARAERADRLPSPDQRPSCPTVDSMSDDETTLSGSYTVEDVESLELDSEPGRVSYV